MATVLKLSYEYKKLSLLIKNIRKQYTVFAGYKNYNTQNEILPRHSNVECYSINIIKQSLACQH